MDNCNVNNCNDLECTRCLPGYFKTSGICRKCHLYCQSCNVSQCYNCYPSNCPDICSYANCEQEGCFSNAVEYCSTCPDGFYFENNFCVRCDNLNCKCSTAKGCDECLTENYDIITFCTDCVHGKYGDSCEQSCITTCNDGTCNKGSGTCRRCKLNEYLDDSLECKLCPGTGRCSSCANSTYCTTCSQRWYWNPTCQYDCTGCLDSCNRNDGCSSGCDDTRYYNIYNPGKKGYECIMCFSQCKTCANDTHCTSCKDNFWGTKCLYSCNNCDGTCDEDKGCVDSCELGYYKEQVEDGYECKPCSELCKQCLDSSTCQVCEDGYYVDDITTNCKPCPINCNNSLCDGSNGICTSGCSPRSTGNRCNKQCPTNCLECDQFNLTNCISCKSEFYGDSCDHSCSRNCKTFTGIQECHKEDGACPHGCVDKYWTKTCTEACPDGCTNQACNETNGECFHGCASGYHGANCSLNCPDTCSVDGCFQANGTCKPVCTPGSADNQCGTGK